MIMKYELFQYLPQKSVNYKNDISLRVIIIIGNKTSSCYSKKKYRDFNDLFFYCTVSVNKILDIVEVRRTERLYIVKIKCKM